MQKFRLQIAGLGLLVGALGQMAFFGRLFPHHSLLCTALALVPWFTIFTITFCNAPFPCGPRTFRYILLFAMIWYGSMSLLAEALIFYIQPVSQSHFSLIAGRVLMYLFGAFAFFVFIKASIIIHRHENKTDA